ncbi:unnamed protein product [Durusdinium trenchii]|uniref:Uncharacterized protein n=1 Tax=Durusdinium trenchii TaxID=1381693 RepID=A0ABP0JDK6_9DINO
MGAGVSSCCSSALESNELHVQVGMVLVEAKSSRFTAFRSMTMFGGLRQKAQLGDNVDELPICPLHGVSLSFMQEFGAANKTKVGAKDYSIGGLCVKVIKPVTMFKNGKPCLTTEEADTLLSYAEVGFRDDITDEKKRPAFVDMAMHFVSHAWRYDFATFLSALANWDSHQGRDEFTYFWVDAFVVNQHIADSYPMEWWSTRFAQAVGDVRSTILVSLPWEDPIPLKRVWVIWEIFCTNQMGARFDIAMPKDTMDNFREALINSFTTVQTALSGVDVGLSSAYHKSHQEMVHDEIRRTIGFTKLNEMVQLRMTRWLTGAATRELQIMKKAASAKNKKERIGLQDNLGRMLRESGNFEGAEYYFKELLQEIEQTYGKDHALALSCLNQLAVTLQKANHIDEALQRHRDCLQRRKRVLGENHEETLQSVSNLAVLLSLHRPLTAEVFQEARELYSQAVKGREMTIGAKDPRTLYTLSNFARFLSEAPEPSNDLFTESEQLHQRAVQSLKDLLQQGHPLTLSAMHNQACSWLDRCLFDNKCDAGGPIDESVSQLRLVHKLRIEKLGKEHPDTQQTERKLQEITRTQKQLSQRNRGAEQGKLESFSSFEDFYHAHFETVCSAEDFKQVRKHMHEGMAADLVFDDLLATGFIDEDGFMTTGMQPYNFLAHIISGDLVQRKCEVEQEYLGPHRVNFVVAHNKPESEEMWSSSDPSWIGKASMSQNHRFLAFKSLRWENFNVISIGLECGSMLALENLKAMKDAATHWVQSAPGWSENTGFYLAVWPLTTIPCMHLHMVDLSCIGPSFERLSKKMLPLNDAIQVLEAEVAQGIGTPPQ